MKVSLPVFPTTFAISLALALVTHAAPPPAPAGPQDPQTELGNIYWDNEPVVIQCLAQGDSVDYSVKNFWGKVVDSGKAPVQAGVAAIKPNLKVHGWFDMTVDTGAGSKELLFAIIAAKRCRRLIGYHPGAASEGPGARSVL